MTDSALLGAGLVALFGALLFAGMMLTASKNEMGPFARARAAMRGRSTPGRSLHQIAGHASAFAERSLDRHGRRGGLERALERAGINMRPGEFVVIVAGVAFGAFMIGALFTNVVIAIILAALTLAGTRFWVSVHADRRRAKFEGQLEQALPLMAGSLRAGFGLMQAIDAVARETEPPIADEFRRIVVESRLGRDVDDSLHALAQRIGSDDFNFVVEAIEIHRHVGGDLAEVLDNVTDTIRDRNKVRRHLKTLTAEGRMSAGILFALPIVMFFVIQILNPDYVHQLTGETIGQVMLAGAAALMVVGGLWIRKMIKLVF